MSKFILILVCVFLEINLYSQNFSIDENEFLNYLGSNQLSKAKEILPKLIDIAKKEYKDTSFQFCKTFYYNALINIVEGSETLAIKNLIESKKYFKKKSQKTCNNTYHNILDKLSTIYYLRGEFQNAYGNSNELMELEYQCRTFGNYEYKMAVDVYASVCMEIPEFQNWGAKLLLNQVNINNSVLEKIKNDNNYYDLKISLISENIRNINIVKLYYFLNNDTYNAIITNDLLNQFDFYENIGAKIKYELLGSKLFLKDFESSILIIQDQIDLIKSNLVFPENSIEYFSNLALLYRRINNFSESSKYYQLAIYSANKNGESDKNNLKSLELYHYLADSYMNEKKYDLAFEAIQNEIKLIKISGKENSQNLIRSYFLSAELHFRIGNYKECDKFCELLSNKKANQSSAAYRSLLDIQIKSLIKQRKYSECLTYAENSLNYDLSNINNLFNIGSKSEKEIESDLLIFQLENNLQVFLKNYNSNSKISETIYQISLLCKSLLLESDILFKKYLKTTNDSSLIVSYNYLNKLNTEIAYNKSNNFGENFNSKKLVSISDSIDKLLSRKISKYIDYKKNFYLTCKDVQTNLNNNEASIEFSRYYDDSDSSYNYMALIVKQGDKHPQLIKLFKESELKQYSSEADLYSLYDLIWKPLLPYINGVKTIYYSPSGLLNNIPFQALYKEENDQREYVMDKFTLHQLTSTRYLALDLKKKEQEAIEPSIALFGGINYNDFPNAKVDTLNYQSSEAALVFKRELDSTRTGASYLLGTKTEVNNIAQLLNGKSWNVDITEGKNASENKIKSLSGNNSKAILHIATHGFAYPDKEEKRKDRSFSKVEGNDLYTTANNPMIRSGLLFGGANITLKGKGDSLLITTNEDGVLTAYELSQLDLSNTKLAVLSACETGKGAIQGSEGTFGLKRALKLAGVDNMIVSLWKVPDDATMEMMTLFYTELANTKKPVSSFETAQKKMRDNHPKEPEKWAGFVFVR